MNPPSGKKKAKTDKLCQVCVHCGTCHPRGVSFDYEVECECGAKFTVRKSERRKP